MSLDSILENPSLKNLILNNSVSDYQGFLTGMSSNNFLEVFGPKDLRLKIADQIGEGQEKVRIDAAKDKAIRLITSSILDSNLGAYYVKDIVAQGNIIDDNILEKLYQQGTKKEIMYNIYSSTFKVLVEGEEMNGVNVPNSMKPTILKKRDSIYTSMIPGDVDEDVEDNYANMSDMVRENEKVFAGVGKIKVGKIYKERKKKVKRKRNAFSPAENEPVYDRRMGDGARSVPFNPYGTSSTVIEEEVEVVEKYSVPKYKTVKYSTNNIKEKTVNTSFKSPSLTQSNLTAIVIKNPKYAIPTRNQKFLSVFFNAISQIDMSLATPYLELTFFNMVPIGDPQNKLNQVAYMRFDSDNNLMKMSRFVINKSSRDGKDVMMANKGGFDVDDLRAHQHIGPNEQIEGGFQNIFQSPQTLNNPDANNVENIFGGELKNGEYVYNAAKTVLDPFAPMLSLNNFSVTVSEGGYYAVSSRQASMQLTLHDRSRLADVTPFVTPETIGKTSVKVTFGWCHPLADPHSRAERNNIIANFIDSMRETAYYRLSSSNMRLEGSQATIDVKMDFMGGREFKKIPSFSGSSIEVEELRSTFKLAMDYITETIFPNKGNVHKNLKIVEKAIDSFDEIVDNKLHKEFIEELQVAYSAIRETKDQSGFTREMKESLFRKMLVLIGVFSDNLDVGTEFVKDMPLETLIAVLEAQDLNEKRIGYGVQQEKFSQELFFSRLDGVVGTGESTVRITENSSETQKEQYKALQKIERITPDYFTSICSMNHKYEEAVYDSKSADFISYLRFTEEDKKKYPKGFVSLGKLIQNLVALPMTTQNLYNEIQTIYYPVNSEAGGARKYTTASIPISVKRLYEEFEKHRKEGNHFSPDFVFKILSNMLQDRNAVCYGLFRQNKKIEHELETKFGYSVKDNVISLNQAGQEAAYALFRENFPGDSSDVPTLSQIVADDEPNNSSNKQKNSGQSASAAANNQTNQQNNSNNSNNKKSNSEPSEQKVDPRKYRQTMYSAWLDNYRKDGIKDILKKYYDDDKIGGPASTDSFKLIHLKLDVETCQVLKSGADFSELTTASKATDYPYDSSARILRLHVYDAHLSPRNGLSFISEKVTRGENYFDAQTDMSPEDIQALDDNKYESMGDDGTGLYSKKHSRHLIQTAGSKMIINMPPWLLKKYLKREYPSITYGAVNSVVKSINLSSTTDNEISYGKAVQSWQDQEEGVLSKFIVQQKMDLNIIPSTIDMQIMGCPFLKVCGQIYVDTGTNTDMDNVYAIHSFSHSISNGNFVTTVNLSLPFAASTSNLRNALSNSLLAIGDKLIPKNSTSQN